MTTENSNPNYRFSLQEVWHGGLPRAVTCFVPSSRLTSTCICCRLSVTLIARLGLNLQRAGAPPPTRTEDLDSTELDVIRFKDPRPPQPLEETTVDDQDFELAAERENARVEVGLSEQQELNRGQG
jgi:hypothetical protein